MKPALWVRRPITPEVVNVHVSKSWFTCEMVTSHRKSGSLNPYPVTKLLPEVGLMYLLRMRRDYRHKSPRKSTKSRCLAPKMAATLQENGCAEVKYDVRFKTGSKLSNMVETAHAQWKIAKMGKNSVRGHSTQLLHTQCIFLSTSIATSTPLPVSTSSTCLQSAAKTVETARPTKTLARPATLKPRRRKYLPRLCVRCSPNFHTHCSL